MTVALVSEARDEMIVTVTTRCVCGKRKSANHKYCGPCYRVAQQNQTIDTIRRIVGIGLRGLPAHREWARPAENIYALLTYSYSTYNEEQERLGFVGGWPEIPSDIVESGLDEAVKEVFWLADEAFKDPKSFDIEAANRFLQASRFVMGVWRIY